MKRSQMKFYRKGVDNQKIPDIIFTFSRVDIKRVLKWTPKQKKEATDFMDDCRRRFNVFSDTVIAILNDQPIPKPLQESTKREG